MKFKWEIFLDGNELIINLNDGLNKALDINHDKFYNNLDNAKEEINFHKKFYKTKINIAPNAKQFF